MAFSGETQSNVALFLLKVKMAVSSQNVRWVPRRYKDFTSLGLTLDDALYILKSLTPKNYYHGPNLDLNGDGTDIWEFVFKDIETDIYIKLKFEGEICKILSFHKPEKPYELPYD